MPTRNCSVTLSNRGTVLRRRRRDGKPAPWFDLKDQSGNVEMQARPDLTGV